MFSFQVSSMHSTGMLSCYHLQHSCGKVMFSQASVILFTPWADIPLDKHPPADTLWADPPPTRQTVPLGRHPRKDTHRQTPPRPDTPWAGQAPSWENTSPQQTATAVDGTHPTGMHSCLNLSSIFRPMVAEVV